MQLVLKLTSFFLSGVLCTLLSGVGREALYAQDDGVRDVPQADFGERVEMQFGVHTDKAGNQSWNVAIKLIGQDGHQHISLHDAETAVADIAESHISQLQHTQCLSSEQIAKLKLAAKLQAHELVRKGEAFLRQAEAFPIQKKSNARLEARVGQFKIDNAGALFAAESLFVRTWSAIVSSTD